MASWLPWAIHGLEVSILLVVLAFTPPNSLIRPGLFPVIVALSWYALPLNRHDLPTKLVAGSISMNTVGTVCQYLDSVLISRWSFTAQGPTSSRGGQRHIQLQPEVRTPRRGSTTIKTLWARLRWGLFASTAWRAPATPWQVKNVPPFDLHDRQRVPSRTRFLVSKTITLVICLLLIDALDLAPQDVEQNTLIFAWKNVGVLSRWREISRQDILIRSMVTLIGWTSIYCVLQACYCILAITSVGFHLTRVDEWPYLFGSVGDCCSIRAFWGRFWHQSLRQRISSPAYYITYSFVGFQQGGLIARYMNIFLTFFISGLLHVAEEYGTGVPLEKSGSMRFFCTQAVGIVLEDAFQVVIIWVFGDRSNRTSWFKSLGYLWFVCWMAWSSPAWLYPKLQCAEGGEKDRFLPFSVLKAVLPWGRGY